jgi:O-antigen/teichoic acid export membrane protein
MRAATSTRGVIAVLACAVNERFSFVTRIFSDRKTVTDTSIVFLGNATSYGMIMVASVIAARRWGAAEYGNIALLNSLSTFLFIPMSLGLNHSMNRFVPVVSSADQRTVFGHALMGVLANSAIVCALLFATHHWFLRWIHVPLELLIFGAAVAIASVFYGLSEALLRGRKQFKAIAALRLGSTSVFLLSFLILVARSDLQSFRLYSSLYIASLLLFAVAVVVRWPPRLAAELSWFAAIYRFGALLTGNTLITILVLNGDLLLLNVLLGRHEIGIYAAYQSLARQLFVVFFNELFLVVFLPSIATTDRRGLYRTIRKSLLGIFAASLVIVAVTVGLLLKVFGRAFPWEPSYIAITSVGIAFLTLFQILNSLVSMDGDRGARRALVSVAIVLPVAIPTQIWGAHAHGLLGAMLASTAISLLLFVSIFLTARSTYADAHTRINTGDRS